MATINAATSKTAQEKQLEQAIRTKNSRVEELRSDFDLVVAQTIPDYEELTPAQRGGAISVLTNWAGATNANKVDTTHAVQGLYGAVLDLLIDEIIHLRQRVAALENE